MSKITLHGESSIENFKITFIDRAYKVLRFKLAYNMYQLSQTDFSVDYKDNLVADLVLSIYNKENNQYVEIDRVQVTEALSTKIVDISKKHRVNHVYNNIDKRYLLIYLTHIGLVSGFYSDICRIYDNDVRVINKRIEEHEKAIRELKDRLHKLKSERLGPTGHGSKIYGQLLKIKVSNRNMDKGHKKGDYIEVYNACIGDTHPVYGGVLTDLRTLPYGETVFVKNGNWLGNISYNDKGNKTLYVYDTKNNVELTEDNCCYYIEVELLNGGF